MEMVAKKEDLPICAESSWISICLVFAKLSLFSGLLVNHGITKTKTTEIFLVKTVQTQNLNSI